MNLLKAPSEPCLDAVLRCLMFVRITPGEAQGNSISVPSCRSRKPALHRICVYQACLLEPKLTS